MLRIPRGSHVIAFSSRILETDPNPSTEIDKYF